jgi:murein DD-endopeptidase MepM/ murein hydrolase activator NlpD
MTQRKNARNPRSSWHRSFGAQSLCWLSSFSLMSSGLVLAQTESAIDNIVPTTENTQTRETAPQVTIERNTTSKQSEAQSDFSSRRSRLRQRLRRNVAQQNSEQAPRIRSSNQTSEAIQRLRQARTNQNESAEIPIVRKLKPRIAESQRNQTPEVRVRKPVEATSKLPELSRNDKPVNTVDIDNPAKDYNNAYIDPTDYSAGNTGKEPDTVILTERSSGCRSVLASGVRSGCVKAPVTASLRERVTASNNNNSDSGERAPKPSWIRKSQNINVASSVNVRRTVTTTTASNNKSNSPANWRNSRIVVTTNRINNLNSVDVTRSLPRASVTAPNIALSSNKNTYHPNRFIPNPSNFAPSVTSLAGTPTPNSGTLPPPVNAVNMAPRESRVAYNIPLESTLPRVAYSGGGIAYNPNGLIFPLSIPASITSIFGWRTHPITGQTRFHSGTDIGAAMGTPVIAAFTGQVEVADFVGGYGLTAVLNHNGAVQTLYGHMSQLFVQPGQWVQQGTVIGLVGSTGVSTGPHLHFEVRQLTPEGWVATDPGVHLQYALSQLMQSVQTAQVLNQE